MCLLSHVQLLLAPWTVACQTPACGIFQARLLEVGCQHYPGDLPDSGLDLRSLLLHWQADYYHQCHLLWHNAPKI